MPRRDHTLVASDEHGDHRPHIAGGVKFESHVAPAARRGLHSAQRAKNPIAEVMSEFMTPDGQVIYNDD